MAGTIPRAFIDDLIARIDIVELIDARVPLKRSGANYTARCPFHNEKTPSFSVSRDKQFYHCFGCGASGNAVGFLIEYERLSFVEAIETLAEIAGVTVPREVASSAAEAPDDNAASLYELLAGAARFFARQLRDHPDAAKAVGYLKGRGVSGEIASRFQLGFAPPGWRNLPAEFQGERGVAAGLLIVKDSQSSYDRFRNRIMFPIRDRRGRVVAFGGRAMDDEPPKYLNSPETAVFIKHREVYGLYELLKLVRRPESILVVEGYMDVVALAQHGVANAVATLGTATSIDHVNLLFRYTRELVFSFDGDRAGQAAAWKALETALPALKEGRSIRFLMMPAGEDPDSLVRQEGGDAFRERLGQAVPLSEFFFGQLSEAHPVATLEGLAALKNAATPLLAKLPDGAFRDLMQQRLRQVLGEQERDGSRKSSTFGVRPPKALRERKRPSALRTLLALLLQHPQLYRAIDSDALRDLRSLETGGDLVQAVLDLLGENPDVPSGVILERVRGTPHEKSVVALSTWETLVPEEGVEAEFRDALERFARQRRHERLDALLRKQKLAGLDAAERDEMLRLLKQR